MHLRSLTLICSSPLPFVTFSTLTTRSPSCCRAMPTSGLDLLIIPVFQIAPHDSRVKCGAWMLSLKDRFQFHHEKSKSPSFLLLLGFICLLMFFVSFVVIWLCVFPVYKEKTLTLCLDQEFQNFKEFEMPIIWISLILISFIFYALFG